MSAFVLPHVPSMTLCHGKVKTSITLNESLIMLIFKGYVSLMFQTIYLLGLIKIQEVLLKDQYHESCFAP